MTAVKVTLVLDRYDGAQNPYVTGGGTLTPSLEFPDPADQMLIGQAPVPFTFRAGSLPQVEIIANDTAGPQGETSPGWTWNIAYSSNTPGSPAAASYYVLSTNGLTQYLSDLAAVPVAQPGLQYLPLPSGTATAGYVPIATGAGQASAWGPNGSGGGGSGTVTTVSVATANGFAGTVANPTTTPAVTVKTSVTGLLKGNGTAVSAATAGTDYVAPTGSGAALTGITAAQVGADASGAAAAVQTNLTAEVARAEAAEALALPLTGGAMSGAIAMGSHKVTGLTNGSLSTDAAAFGQIPTALPPNGSAGGDLSGSYPNPTLLKVNGSVASGQYARGNGSAVALSAIQAADVPTLNQSTSGNAATATTAAACSGNAATATNLAGGATLPAYVAPKVFTLTDGSSVAVNAALGNVARWPLGGASHTLAAPSNLADGEILIVRIIYSGSYTPLFNAIYDFAAVAAPTWTATNGKVDEAGFRYNADANAGAGALVHLGSLLGL